MNYYWTDCPRCGCQVTIHFIENAAGLTGSVRRWSSDRATNDGRRLEVARADIGPAGNFQGTCVCGGPISVDAARIERAATERPAI
jgi:hypothetical protein